MMQAVRKWTTHPPFTAVRDRSNRYWGYFAHLDASERSYWLQAHLQA